ncbi:MAG: serine acetyltransferase [Saprospiraceae bacterium]|nr:serine acetyltransferase [Saprospiraceae bacterium]
MDEKFIRKLYAKHQECPDCPSLKIVTEFFEDLLGTLFPEFSDAPFHDFKSFEQHVVDLKSRLQKLLIFCELQSGDVPSKSAAFFGKIPTIYQKLLKDIDALEKGDPAAKSQQEVIRTYPGFYAIAAHRFAHELELLEVPIVPRMLSEHAHSHTGIDIHPGASIGEYFCIDHGTGIVIGETSLIGNHVKIYQGVTLGALSVRKEDATTKRHPTIEDHVVLYSGATILGGETVIGHHSVIGGNVWITKSIEPNSKVYYQAKMHHGTDEEHDLLIYKTEN